MKSVQKGFTLIELMIVIAIIGILAAIAIPAYQNYVIRAQATEGSSIIGSLETAFEECYANTGTATSCNTNAAVGIPASKVISGTYVKSVQLGQPADGQIQVTYNTNANADIAGKTVVWSAYKSKDGNITWLCNDGTATTNAVAATGLVPVTGGNAAVSGSVPLGAYLPSICD